MAAVCACAMAVACDYSYFMPEYDIPDATLADNPFNQPDDWVPSDDGMSGFMITSASPLSGPSAGGTRVTIEGRGFTSGSTVLFGPTAGGETVVENEYTIRTTAPAWTGYSQTVDLWVVRDDGKKTVLRPGFRYQSDAGIISVEPSGGPVAGGTPITLSGYGFAPESDVIVDGRSALSVTRIDDSTIIAVTPPGEAGEVEVLVLSGNSTARLGRAYTYFERPDGITCSPGVVDADGTDGDRQVMVDIAGSNLDGVRTVSLSSGRVTSMSTPVDGAMRIGVDYSGIVADGAVDLTLSGPGGLLTIESCFTVLESAQVDDPDLIIHAFTPKKVPAAGGVTGTMTVTGLDTGSPVVLLVKVGSSPVSVTEVPDMNTVRFIIPAGTPGAMDVTLESPLETAKLNNAFTYTRDATVEGIEPSTAPPGGGTSATVSGSGLANATEVTVGPLPAIIAGEPTDDAIPIIIPAVGPGVHDVVVSFADGGQAVAKDALTCTSDGISVKAVSPDSGSLSGGTVVFVTGSGLEPGTRVFFGSWEAEVIDDADPGRMTVRSPAGDEEGSVNVYVVGDDGIRHTLNDAFTYFNPTGFLGGTWGPEISGSVNVTVIDSVNDTPVPQAFVMLDSDPETPYRGFTDGRGMITLSGRGLRGAVMVTATRQDYTTWSVAGVDAQNVTIYLEPLYNQINPSTGNGDDDDNVFPLTPGLVTGRVTGTDKEFIVPAGSCEGIPLINGTMCTTCETDGDCGDGAICVLEGETSMTCSVPCVVSDDCPDGWNCYQAGDQGTVCKPTPGKEEVRCGVADSTSLRWADNFGPGAIMSSAGTYALSSRLGDVAIYCLGGYRRTLDGVFVPVTMGLTRHVPVTTSAVTTGYDVRLNIPLDRTLRLRMIAAPGGPGGPTSHIASMTIYLGSDGYLNLWPALTGTDRAIFDFEHLPDTFDGALDGAELFMSADAESPTSSGAPYSVVYPATWKPWNPEAIQVLDDGSVTATTDIALEAVSSCSSDDRTMIVDKAHRAWLLEKDVGMSALPAIGNSDINACAWLADGTVMFAGARSTVYRFDPADMSETTESVDFSYTRLSTARACGDTVWVAGGDRLYARTGAGTWNRVGYGSPAPVTDLECLDDATVVGTGEAGLVFVADATSGRIVPIDGVTEDLNSAVFSEGRLVVTGSTGTLLTGPSPDELSVFTTGLLDDFTASGALSAGRILVGGSRGILAIFDGETLTVIRKPAEQAEVSTFAPYGSTGSPVLAFRRAAVMAGPFVNIPQFGSPPKNWLWLNRDVSWGIKVPPAPSFTYLRLYTVAGVGRWSIIAGGDVRAISLPDLALASGLDLRPVQPGTVSLSAYTVLSPGFDIDNYDSTSLYSSKWDAWSLTAFTTKFF